MFKGVIKGNTRKILMEILKEKSPEKIYVGCAGAFTIQTLIVENNNSSRPVKEIFSSDVSIYTNAIGLYLAEQDYDFSIGIPQYAFLEEYISKGLLEKTAVILYLQDIAEFVNPKNHHAQRMYSNFIATWENVVRQKMERLLLTKEMYDRSGIKFTYVPEDVVKTVERVKEGEMFVAFPPFFKGGYEKLYKFMETVVVSEKLHTKYEMFEDKSLVKMVDTLLENKADFVIGTNRGELFQEKLGVYQVAFDYFSPEELVTFISSFPTKKKFAKIDSGFIGGTYGITLAKAEDVNQINIDTNIDIQEIPQDLFESIRRSRLSSKVTRYAMPMIKLGVFAEGKLIGVLGIDITSIKGGGNSFYLLADVAVVNSNDVAKLVGALATCRQIQDFIRTKYLFNYDFISTTAFTDKPVAMKYRNFWLMDNRGKDKSGQKFINYSARMGMLSKQEILTKWLKLKADKQE